MASKKEDESKLGFLSIDKVSKREFLKGAATGMAVASLPSLSKGLINDAVAHEADVCLADVSNLNFQPTLKLTETAKSAPFMNPGTILDDYRNLLLRREEWLSLPLDLTEVFFVDPAPGVMGGDNSPVSYSLGFGAGILPGGCGTNTCGTHTNPTGNDSCNNQICNEQDCKNFVGCQTHSCSEHSCEAHLICNEQKTETSSGLINLVNMNYNHPFIQELKSYFGIDSAAVLANTLARYCASNMYDQSLALQLGQSIKNNDEIDIFSYTGTALAETNKDLSTSITDLKKINS